MPREMITLTPSLNNGLNVREENIDSVNYLEALVDLKATPFGAAFYNLARSGYTSAATWPNPQTVVSPEGVWALENTTVRTVNTTDWTTATVTLTALSGGAGSITSGGVWHVGVFGTAWFATNGSTLVFKDHEGTYYTTSYRPNSLCMFRNRLFLGGLNNFTSAEHTNAMEALSPIGATYGQFQFAENEVYYSTADVVDVYSLLRGTFSRADLEAAFQYGEAGYLAMNWKGAIYCIKELGDGVVVYGARGISYLKFESEPIALSRRDLADFGIAGRGAVAGDDREHHFIDENGHVRKLNARLEISEPIYGQFTSTLSGTIVGTFDPINRVSFFCNATKGYMLSANGLSEITATFNSVFVYGGVIRKVATTAATLVQSFLTGVLDFGDKDHKTFVGAYVGLDVGSSARLHYRDSLTGAFSATAWLVIGSSGYVEFMVSGIEFQLEVKRTSAGSPSYTKLEVIVERNGKLGLSRRL